MPTSHLNDLLKTLLTAKIEFVLIGGFASVFYGSSYVTQDLDICMVLTPENINRLRSTLKDFNPLHRINPAFKPSFMERPLPGEEFQNIYLQTDLGVLDILTTVTSAGDFTELKSRAFKSQLFGYPCDVISIDDLIRSKESVGRKKDLLVVEELKDIRNKLSGSLD